MCFSVIPADTVIPCKQSTTQIFLPGGADPAFQFRRPDFGRYDLEFVSGTFRSKEEESILLREVTQEQIREPLEVLIDRHASITGISFMHIQHVGQSDTLD